MCTVYIGSLSLKLHCGPHIKLPKTNKIPSLVGINMTGSYFTTLKVGGQVTQSRQCPICAVILVLLSAVKQGRGLMTVGTSFELVHMSSSGGCSATDWTTARHCVHLYPMGAGHWGVHCHQGRYFLAQSTTQQFDDIAMVVLCHWCVER